MKKFYNKLKESKNYNVIIGAIALSLMTECILAVITTVAGAAISIVQLQSIEGAWAQQLMMFRLLYSMLGIICFVASLMVVRLACQRNSKFIFVAAALLIFVDYASYGFAPAAGHCAVLGICWFFLNRKESADITKLSKILIVVLMLFMILKTPLILHGEFDMEGLTTSDYIWGTVSLFAQCVFNPEFFLAAILWKQNGKAGVLEKSAIAVWIITIIMFLASNIFSLTQMATFDTWSEEAPDSEMKTEVEAGDWSEWETE